HIDAVRMAFSRHSEGGMHVPEVVHLPGLDGGFHVKSAGFAGPPSYVAVKINGNFPGNPSRRGLPTIQGAIVLFDSSDGFPLAVMDSAEITSARTAAATAVAAGLLAHPQSEVATIIGCGVQGRIQLEALRIVLPIRQVYTHDADQERAADFAAQAGHAMGIAITPVASFSEATRRSDVIVTCTTSTRAFLQPAHVRPGAFVAAVGADNPDKSELAPDLMRASRVIVDILDQCARIGDLNHAIAAGVMTRADVHAELGDVIRGVKPGRGSAEEVIVFDSTGSAIQDVAVAGRVYERAREQGIGMKVSLS
ncbi:MAG: ornithine cyclodeaminase family protein, partial [Chloroflexi bacterium]|nr:ornithine cyclodeaminase family protein [Chloroflexota bacterium]